MSSAKETRRKEAKALLEGFWGKAFNFKDPKPLKIGIDEDLMKSAEAQGLPFDEVVIKRALGAYLYTLRYTYALVREKHRYDLQGQIAGEVTEEERLAAKASIKQYHERLEEKTRNRAIDAENQAKAKARKIARENAVNGNKLSG